MKKEKLMAGILVVTLLLTGCGSTATLKNGKQVVAKVKGKTITAEDLYDELKTQGGAVTLTNMIDEFIVNKELKTTDDDTSYAESQISTYKEQYESYGQDFDAALKNAGYSGEDDFKEALVLEHKKTRVTENYTKDQITDSEIQNYYDNDVFGDIKAKHILISPNTDDDMTDEEKTKAEKKALKKAKKIIKELDEGADFEKLAKKYSDDSGTASKGGKITVKYGDVVDEFWNGANELEDGTYSSTPVKSDYGYHIIYRIKQKAKPKLSKVKDDIIDSLVDEKMDDDSTLQTKALVALRKKYKLNISDDELKSSYDSNVNSALTTTSNSSSSN